MSDVYIEGPHFNVNTFSDDELKILRDNIDEELKRRYDQKQNELIQNFCNAYNELIDYTKGDAEFWISYECEECGATLDINVFEEVYKLKPANIKVWG